MKVSILSYDPIGEETVTRCGLSTSSQTPPSQYKVTEEDIKKFTTISRKMKLSSVQDFPFVNYSVEDVSRSFTHQHVRHRMGAHMQQSFRYVEVDAELREDPFFVVPETIIKTGKEGIVNYVKGQLNDARMYKELVKRGVPQEDARMKLPIGTKTFLSTSMNAESMLHYLNVRMCNDAQWEIRSVANALRTGTRFIYPHIFEVSGPSCVTDDKCRGRGNYSCKKDIEELTNTLENKVIIPNLSNFDKLKRREKLKLDLTDYLGYKADENLEKEVGKEFGLERLDLSREAILEITKI